MKFVAADGEAAGLGLDEERVDATAVAADDADRDGVEQQLGARAEQHRVGRALERRGVVRLRQDLAEDEVRLVEAVERAHSLEQLVGDAAHDPSVRAVHVGVQAAEVGDAGRRAHAAEEAVALDDERARAAPRRRRRRREAGRAAAEDDDVVLAPDRRRSRRLGDHGRAPGRPLARRDALDPG